MGLSFYELLLDRIVQQGCFVSNFLFSQFSLLFDSGLDDFKRIELYLFLAIVRLLLVIIDLMMFIAVDSRDYLTESKFAWLFYGLLWRWIV